MRECLVCCSHPMFRAARFQCHRRLLRRSETKRFTRTGLSAQLGESSERFVGGLWKQESVVGTFNRIRDGRFVLDSLKFWAATKSSFGNVLPRLSGIRLGSTRSDETYDFFSVIASRELSYLHSAQSYSDEEYDSSEAGDSNVDLESWRRRLNRFIESDQQEMILKEKNDRRDFSHLGSVLKSMGLYSNMYAKVLVISKVPLPNYRPELDEKRPQRVVVLRPEIKERVEYLLRKHLMQRRDPPSSDAAGKEFMKHREESSKQSLLDYKTRKNISRVEELMNEERRKRQSMRMKNKQSIWQELPEGQKMLSFRQSLPAWKERDNLLTAIAHHQVLVVSGETGCGKTTQLPQYILESAIEAGRGASCSIICTQPRRISAVSVAERVAAERGEDLGESIGYKVRLEGKKGRDTSLLFCTSGILLRRLMKDPDLLGVSHVLVDEIHERGMNEDFLLIVLKGLLSRRADLRLVLMSATLNADLFSKYFDGAPVIHIPGFTYPVESHFLEDVLPMIGHVLTPYNQIDDYGEDKQWRMAKQLRGRSRKSLVNTIADIAMGAQDFADLNYKVRDSFSCWNPECLGFNAIEKLLCHIVKKEKDGAVLVFLTGHEDISAMLEKLRNNPLLGNTEKVLLLGCHGSMATAEQKLIFGNAPSGVRKIILATNMAETSITINDIVFVVDCGKAKETSYDALNNTPCLLPQWISRASARQRRGRAGRVQPGVCYHLYPKAVHDAFDEYQTPELLRTPLQSLCLQIKSLGLGGIKEFLSNALQPPEHRAVHNAVELLKTIGALDDDEELTDLGRHLSTLPVEPRLGKMLLMGSIFRCLDPVLTIAAGLTTRDPFLMPLEKKDLANNARFKFAGDDFSDHLGLVRAYNGWLKALNEGVGGDYCWNNFLSFQTLQGMQSLRRQFLELLADAGFDMEQCSENSSDQDLVRGVICAGLYPGVAAAVQKSKSITFKTKEDGLVNLHQTSVNGREVKLIFPWLVFNEKVKTGSVHIRDSTGVSDSILLLFGGEITRGRDPGHLLMQDGFLEFFMQKDVATLILMLREELDDLIQRKLEDPEMDVFSEGNYLLEGAMELLRGDQCDGTFVFGRKASKQCASHSSESPASPEEDVKGLLQKFVQKGGKHPAPKYTTTEAPEGGYESSVLVRGMSFMGKPAPSKKQAEKDASRVALGWLVQSGSSKSAGAGKQVDLMISTKKGLSKQQKSKSSHVEAALELYNKAKGVVKGSKASRRKRKVELAA